MDEEAPEQIPEETEELPSLARCAAAGIELGHDLERLDGVVRMYRPRDELIVTNRVLEMGERVGRDVERSVLASCLTDPGGVRAAWAEVETDLRAIADGTPYYETAIDSHIGEFKKKIRE